MTEPTVSGLGPWGAVFGEIGGRIWRGYTRPSDPPITEVLGPREGAAVVASIFGQAGIGPRRQGGPGLPPLPGLPPPAPPPGPPPAPPPGAIFAAAPTTPGIPRSPYGRPTADTRAAWERALEVGTRQARGRLAIFGLLVAQLGKRVLRGRFKRKPRKRARPPPRGGSAADVFRRSAGPLQRFARRWWPAAAIMGAYEVIQQARNTRGRRPRQPPAAPPRPRAAAPAPRGGAGAPAPRPRAPAALPGGAPAPGSPTRGTVITAPALPRWAVLLQRATPTLIALAQQRGSKRPVVNVPPTPAALVTPFAQPLTAFQGAAVGSRYCPPCDEKKRKPGKPKAPRSVCYQGSYRETATGLKKIKRRKVPCQ